MFRIPRIFGSMKVPIFGTLDQALNFAAHNGAALPRYAKWGLSIPIAAGWFIWPALTQDFKAGIGIGITVEEEQVRVRSVREWSEGGGEDGGHVKAEVGTGTGTGRKVFLWTMPLLLLLRPSRCHTLWEETAQT